MTFIDDNGNEIEYSGPFAITKQAVSFFNGALKGDVSINFQIDNNSKNRNVLGYYGPQSVNQVAFTRQQFNRTNNGSVIDRGYIVIQSSDEDSIECFYLSGNSNWMQLLTGLITELDLDDYTQLWTSENIQARNSATSGICFPLVDWISNGQRGNNSYSLLTPYETKAGLDIPPIANENPNILPDIYPCFYLHTLVTEMLRQSGLKLSGNIANDVLYKSLIIGPFSPLLKRITTLGTIRVGGTAQAYSAGVLAKYTSFSNVSANPDGLFSLVSQSYTANKKTGLIFRVSFSPGTVNSTNYVSIYKNGVEALRYDSGTTGMPVVSNSIACSPGDVFEIYGVRSTAANITITSLNIYEAVSIWPRDWVRPKAFLPPLQCIEVLKFVINYFNCLVYFNESSKTISLNIVDKLAKENAQDWSQYYITHSNDYTRQVKNNLLTWQGETNVSLIDDYDNKHKVKFGGGNIETDKDVKEDRYLVSFPFQTSDTVMNNNGFWLSNSPLIKLTDGAFFEYDNVSSGGTGIRFYESVAGTPLEEYLYCQYVRITNNKENKGIFISTRTATGGGLLNSYVLTDDLSHTDGTVISQEIEMLESVRILTIRPSTNLSDIGTSANIRLWDETFRTQIENTTPLASTDSDVLTSLPYAIFVKPVTGEPIDQWKNNLAIDNPTGTVNTYTDPTIKDLYYKSLSRVLNNPTIQAKFIIPEAIYKDFKFNRFIYLKTENLTGYFFLDSIVNYRDGNSPVDVTLLML